MTQSQNAQEQSSGVQVVNMYLWRLGRAEAEKRTESINRQILRRQFTN